MHVPVQDDTSFLIRPDQLAEPVGHHGRIREIALVQDQMVIDVPGVGIVRRDGDAARLGQAQQAQVAPVLPVGLGFHQHQDGGRAVLGVEIGENARILRPAVGAGAVEEMRIVRQLHAAPDPFVEQDVRRGRGRGNHHGDVVILGNPGQVGVGQAPPDHLVAVVQQGERADDRIVGNGPFRSPQLEFQADVPVHREAVRPHLHPVFLLLEAEQGGRDGEICAGGDGEHQPAGPREHVVAEPRQAPQQRRKQLEQQGDGEGQGQEGQVHDSRITVDQVHLIELEADAGVEDDALEGPVDVQADGDDDRHVRPDRDDVPQARILSAEPAQQGPSDGVERNDQGGDEQVHQHHRPEGVEEGAVGIQQRGEQLGSLPQLPAVQVDSADEQGLQEARRQRRRNRRLDVQEQDRSSEKQDDGQPKQGDVMPFRLGNGLRRDLEYGLPVRHHGDAHAAGEGLDRIAVAQTETRVHPVEGAGFQFIDHFQAHDYGYIPLPDGAGQEPFRAVIDIGHGRRERSERRGRVAPAVAEPLEEGAGTDVVVPERELMGPGLEGVLAVPVHYHVLRQVFQTEPGLGVGRQGLRGVTVQQGEPRLHAAAEVAGRGFRVRVRLVRQQGGDQQRQGDGKDRHPRPEPYAEGLIHGDRARL